MSQKLATVWVAPPHTIAKIDMLRSYLEAWFSILGASFPNQDLWYIDGFAGPGEYKNSKNGSPIAALEAAEAAIAMTGARWKAGKIHCVFIEEDSGRFVNLQTRLASLPENARIKRQVFQGTFVAGIEALAKQMPNPFNPARPLFAFVDPFGPEGPSFETIRHILGRATTEVLVNLDSDGIARVFRAGEDANYRARLNEVFGDSEWERELSNAGHQAQLARTIVTQYKRRLRKIPNVRYVFSFEMRSKKAAIDYHLVFASQHPTGLEKMKEVMKRIDQDGSYSFSDDGVGQQTLFSFNDPAGHAADMAAHFARRVCTYEEVKDYTLNESPFPNPKAMLKALETQGHIDVACSSERRKGTYPERLHESIRITFR